MTVGALHWVSFFYGTAKTAGLKTGSRGEETNLAPPWGLIQACTGLSAGDIGLADWYRTDIIQVVQGHDESQG
jgi:hypothetical protein